VTTLALILVLLSAITHAIWNLLAKRASNQDIFIWWLLVAISGLLSPLAVVLFWQDSIVYPGWWFILGTVVLHVLYFLFLGRSYTYADLSLVYPIARGIGPALVPVLGVLVLDETITMPAVAGIVAVVAGIYAVYWWGRLRHILRDPFGLFRDAGVRYALLTGLVITVFSVWDKAGVRYVNPFLYMYLLALGSALCLAPYVLRLYGIRTVIAEGRKSVASVILAGALTFLSYGLILLALQFSRVSYVSPSRAVGIVVGVVLGNLVLGEPFGRGRVIGSGLIVSGLVLIAIAP
jgi:drug/metabolite transporter (DMT)-like permease